MARPFSRGHAVVRALASLGLAAATVAGTGCQSSNGDQPILTDAREVVTAAIESTAALQSVHARLEISFGASQPAQFVGQVTIDADVDLLARNIAAHTATTGQGQSQATDIILVAGQQFSRNSTDSRWTQFPTSAGGPGLPTNVEVAAALTSAIQGPGVGLSLADAEPCGEATCYHVTAQLDSAASWRLLGPILRGTAGPAPPGLELAPTTLDILVDQATRLPVAANIAISFRGTSVTMSVAFTNHDVPLRIVGPPATIVDQLDANGGQVAPATGEVSAPQPAETPQESLP